MTRIFLLLMGVALGAPLHAAAENGAVPQPAPAPALLEPDLGQGLPLPDPADAADEPSQRRRTGLIPGARLSLTHELGGRWRDGREVTSHRSSLRIEYEKHVADNFFVRLDAMETAHWSTDHRAESRGHSTLAESNVREAYVQFGTGQTSIKLGRQILIWGESDAGAITDVISPRNLTELVFISLEKARIGQFMLTVEQFTPVGDWQFFYVPRARYNRYPESTDLYSFTSGNAAYTAEGSGRLHEYGMRWKKTFGRSDVSLLAASLLDNDRALRATGTLADGTPLFARRPQRLKMLGGTFNLASDEWLLTAEVARKSPLAYNDASYSLQLEKDLFETSLRAEYSLGNGGNHSVSLEAVNRRVLGWENTILPTPRNRNILVFGWRNAFRNETVNVDFLSVYDTTYTSFTHSLFTSYKVTDSVTLGLDIFYLNVKDSRNELYMFRGQNNAILRLTYQF